MDRILAARMSWHTLALAIVLLMPTALARAGSLHDAVGQLLLTGFDGTHADDPGVRLARARAEAGDIGGVIISRYNVESPAQLRALTDAMVAWRTPRPLIIAIDQEGGQVQRLRATAGFTDYPTAADLARGTPADTAATCDALAAELAALHVNLNFAPCVDLAIDPNGPAIAARGRSFGRDAATVVAHAGACIDAHRRHHVLTAAKHFPGHGSASTDTHLGLTDITAVWSPEELAPYAQLIAQGRLDAVMTSHLAHRDLTGGLPFTLSPTALRRLLREGLGYDGLVISDGLEMGGLSEKLSVEEIVVAALAAGHDLLVFAQNAASRGGPVRFAGIDDLPASALRGVEAGLAAGRLTRAQVDAALARVVQAKQSLSSRP